MTFGDREGQGARGGAPVFGLLLLLSGFCGISYEVLYARILSNFIGDQFAVSASVLLTFLVGIGFGTLYAHRLWRFLWLIELSVGLCGVAFALVVGRLGLWLYSGTVVRGGLGESVLVSVALLAVPAFLIGCSVPLFGGYLERMGSSRAFARAYAVYNVGAALTVLAIEFALLRLLGIRATVLTMAALNGAVSLGLFVGYPELRRLHPDRPSPQRFERRALLALALASVASAVFQLLMVRLAECVLGPFRETFALVLALVLGGIALGTAVVDRWKLSFGTVILSALAGLAWLVGGFGPVVHGFAALRSWAISGYATTVLLKLATLAVLMGVPAAAFGATVPSLLRSQGDVARDSGKLLAVSSLANGLGFLLMAFVLHRYFEYGVLALIVAGLACAGALACGGFRRRSSFAAVLLFALAVLLHRARWDEVLLYLGHDSFFSTADLRTSREKVGKIESFKGYQDVFSLVRSGDEVQFFINGFVSVDLGSTSEPLVGAFPALLAPRHERALVVGLGSGMTAGAVAQLFDRTDTIEINPVVVENMWRMKRWNFDIESIPGVRMIVDDGFHFLRASKDRYDLIVNTVTTPLYFSSSKLYTADFFETVRERLAPDGVYVTWIDSRVGDRGLDIVLKTLRRSFRECWIGALRENYFLVVCSPEKLAIRQPRRVEDSRVLADYFYRQAGIPADWIPYGLISTRAFGLIGSGSAPVNTLDFPALEFEIARTSDEKIASFKSRLLSRLSYTDVAETLAPETRFDAVDQTLYLYLLLGDCDLLRRWQDLAATGIPGFEEKYYEARLRHHERWARVANNAVARKEYAWELNAFGRTAEALEEYRKALAVAPDWRACRIEFGTAYEDAGDLDAARREYGTVLRTYPNDPRAGFLLGRVAVKQKRYEEGLPYLAAAAEYFDDAYEPRYYLGLAQEALGRRDQARRSFERALTLKPGDETIAAALARTNSP